MTTPGSESPGTHTIARQDSEECKPYVYVEGEPKTTEKSVVHIESHDAENLTFTIAALRFTDDPRDCPWP